MSNTAKPISEDQLAELDIYLLEPDYPVTRYNTVHRLAKSDPKEPLTIALNTLRQQHVEIALGTEYLLRIDFTPPKMDPHEPQFEDVSVNHYRTRI